MTVVASEEFICLIPDQETTEQRISFVAGELADSTPECRERIATAVLGALITAKGVYSKAMPRVAVNAADDLIRALNQIRAIQSS